MGTGVPPSNRNWEEVFSITFPQYEDGNNNS